MERVKGSLAKLVRNCKLRVGIKLNIHSYLYDAGSHHRSPEFNHALEDTLSFASSQETIKSFSLQKQRVVDWYNHVAIEQTEVTVEGHSPQHWRTISLEGELSRIDQLLSMKIPLGGNVTLKTHLLQCSSTGGTCGYPQFVLNLL